MQDKCPKCSERLITKAIKKQLVYGSIDYTIAQECPKCHYSRDLTGAGNIVSKPLASEPTTKAYPKSKPSTDLNKIITLVLAILVFCGIVWAFFLYPASQKPESAAAPTATPAVIQTSVQATGTPVTVFTPTGVTWGMRLDRYRGFLDTLKKIKAGDNVVWANDGSEALTLVSSEGLFENRLLNNGKRTNYTFLKPGTYNFYLKENSSLRGTVIVEP